MESWKAQFKRRSEEQCRRAFDEALIADFGRALARHGTQRMRRFERCGLWLCGDAMEARECSLGLVVMSAKSSPRGGAAGWGAQAAASGKALEEAFESWKASPGGGALERLWDAMEPAMARPLGLRALELGVGESMEAIEELSRGLPWERELAARLGAARAGDFEVAKYAQVLLEVIRSRIQELRSEGLLPGVALASLRWGRADDGRARSWSAEYGQGSKQEERGAPKKVVAYLSVECGMHARGAEFEFEPAWGPFGWFGMGGWAHSARIRWMGARAAAESDWARFEPLLAKAHAGLLAQGLKEGRPEAFGAMERAELERSAPAGRVAGAARRL